jgi:hypothetical protein
MAKTRRNPAIVVLMVCLASSPWTDTLFAKGDDGATPPAIVSVSSTAPQEAQLLSPGHVGSFVFGEQTLRAMSLPLPSLITTNSAVDTSESFAQRRGGYRSRGRRNGAAQAEMVIGAVAAIAGAAVLTYANRPECSANNRADGCGYGTKVVGTAVTTAGVVTFLTGALSWR